MYRTIYHTHSFQRAISMFLPTQQSQSMESNRFAFAAMFTSVSIFHTLSFFVAQEVRPNLTTELDILEIQRQTDQAVDEANQQLANSRPGGLGGEAAVTLNELEIRRRALVQRTDLVQRHSRSATGWQ